MQITEISIQNECKSEAPVGNFQAGGVMCKFRQFPDLKILHLVYFSLFHLHLQDCIIHRGRVIKLLFNQYKCCNIKFWNTSDFHQQKIKY